MARSRGHPTPGEWEQQKPEFERLYLRSNWTLKAVQEHFSHRGFDATLRQYKTKVNAWGFDLKKIKKPTWHAMLVVMKHRQANGLNSVFLVPVRSSEVTVVRPDKIQKETHRNRSVFDSSDLEHAQAHLNGIGVRTCTEDDPEVLAFFHHISQPDSGQGSSQLVRDPLDQPSISPELVQSDDQSDFVSPSSTQSLHAMTMAPSPQKRAYSMSYDRPSGSRPTLPLAPPLTSQITRAHQDSLSHSQLGRSPSTAHYFDPTKDQETWSAVYELLHDPSCSDQLPDTTRSTTRLQDLEQKKSQMDGVMLLAARWAAPYIRSLSASLDKRVSFADLGREDAKIALREMLESGNRYIFLLCHWMTTVLASLDETELMKIFLKDCCSVINSHPNGHSVTYGSPLELVLALINHDQSNIKQHRDNLMHSAAIFKALWKPESSNYLINQHYHAWLLLDQKQYDEAEEMLVYCLDISKRIMGEQHLVTINCLAMLSRCFAQTDRISDAMVKLYDLLNRLTNCHRYLYAFRDLQQYRLAELQFKTSKLEDAEKLLHDVLAFRVDTFGLLEPVTWSAIEKLQECLRLQGRGEDATRIYQYYWGLYQEEARIQKRTPSGSQV